MSNMPFELPLAFKGHMARMVVTQLPDGPWCVRTEVDGRVLGWEHFVRRAQVVRFRARMQGWMTQLEATERRGSGRSSTAGV